MKLLIALFAFAGLSMTIASATAMDREVAKDLAVWGMPMVSFFAQKEAVERDLGAKPNQIIYWSKPLNHKHKILTPNDVVLYVTAQIELFDGPVVLEVPPADGPLQIFGSIITPEQVPLEDVGGAKGVDKGAGGRILLTPPGWLGEVPAGYLSVRSESYNLVLGFRITPVSFDPADIDNAIAYLKLMKLHPLDSPDAPTVHVDVQDRAFDPRPPYDKKFFDLLNRFVQEEPMLERNESFVQRLASIGIRKNIHFRASAAHGEAATAAWAELQKGFRNVGQKFFKGANWVTPVDPREPATRFTYMHPEDGYLWRVRGQTFHWAIWAPKNLGADTFYLIGQFDQNGETLDGGRSYTLNVPADVPASQFWSVTMYEFETGGTFYDDVPKVAVNSKQADLVTNADGTVTVYFGPEKPADAPVGNYIPTLPDSGWFVLFRWYGPQPELMDGTWTMGDVTAG